ncbi:small integral membrane protein 34A [Sturnira hondurensis]|uniref:small integral membrane protein 34A n=1 Tax=Sturnira hondurensis TaxID=192404 RepID=UPI0018799B51|nr:small integral membrane protein 34A [Sturnira hondurensis]
MAGVKCTPLGAPDQTQASPALERLLRDPLEGRNSTDSTRAPRLPDGPGAAWYILMVIGIYAVVFLFQLASRILRKQDTPLEDIYYSSFTSQLKKKDPPSKAVKCPALMVNRATLLPSQASPEPGHAASEPQTDIQGIP